VPPAEVAFGVKGEVLGRGVVLVGMPDVVLVPVPTVFHGLTISVGITFEATVDFDNDTAAAVLVTTAIAADASSLSLLVE